MIDVGTVRSRGRAGPPSTRLTTADSSPADEAVGGLDDGDPVAIHLRPIVRSLRARLDRGTAWVGT